MYYPPKIFKLTDLLWSLFVGRSSAVGTSDRASRAARCPRPTPRSGTVRSPKTDSESRLRVPATFYRSLKPTRSSTRCPRSCLERTGERLGSLQEDIWIGRYRLWTDSCLCFCSQISTRLHWLKRTDFVRFFRGPILSSHGRRLAQMWIFRWHFLLQILLSHCRRRTHSSSSRCSNWYVAEASCC